MLIMLHEMGVLHKTEIVASDIDKSILEKAKNPKINSKSMEVNVSNYQRYNGISQLTNYFKKEGDYYLFDKTLLQKVSFREINLVTSVPFNKFDLVLCRNVLIYFNNNLQNDVIKLFHNCMFEGSLLAIGAKESMAWCEISKKFSCLNLDEKIYKKNKEITI
jgi:chemotaxis protein methyltransferase CheR